MDFRSINAHFKNVKKLLITEKYAIDYAYTVSQISDYIDYGTGYDLHRDHSSALDSI